MDKETTNKILSQTEEGYNLIATKFSQTRKHFWRGLEFIKDYAAPGDRVLDWGCGNGRLLELIDAESLEYQGWDVSKNLIELARQKYGEKASFAKLDPIQSTLPFDDNNFNTIYSIAVFHHFPSHNYREQIAKEFFRVTKDGGHIVITVWYLWQRKYLKNILANWKNKLLGKTDFDWNDCLISFTDNHGKRFQRFHHAYTKRELKKLFRDAGFEIEKCEIPDGRNIVLIGKNKE